MEFFTRAILARASTEMNWERRVGGERVHEGTKRWGHLRAPAAIPGCNWTHEAAMCGERPGGVPPGGTRVKRGRGRRGRGRGREGKRVPHSAIAVPPPAQRPFDGALQDFPRWRHPQCPPTFPPWPLEEGSPTGVMAEGVTGGGGGWGDIALGPHPMHNPLGATLVVPNRSPHTRAHQHTRDPNVAVHAQDDVHAAGKGHKVLLQSLHE